jgi:hypothetical protein
MGFFSNIIADSRQPVRNAGAFGPVADSDRGRTFVSAPEPGADGSFGPDAVAMPDCRVHPDAVNTAEVVRDKGADSGVLAAASARPAPTPHTTETTGGEPSPPTQTSALTDTGVRLSSASSDGSGTVADAVTVGTTHRVTGNAVHGSASPTNGDAVAESPETVQAARVARVVGAERSMPGRPEHATISMPDSPDLPEAAASESTGLTTPTAGHRGTGRPPSVAATETRTSGPAPTLRSDASQRGVPATGNRVTGAEKTPAPARRAAGPPQVRIGQVNVIVEVPAAPQSRPAVTDDAAGLLFLRSL